MTERGGSRVIVVVLGGETAAARDAQVAYLIEGAYQEYARRADPNAAQFASLPTRRLDVQLAPGTLQANSVTPLPPSPYQLSQGMVIETLSPVRAPIDEPVGQGDEGTTEEME
jgi:D-alanyl-D-alanine carboxypeptidase